MKRIETGLDGAFVLCPETRSDERGFFLKYFSLSLFQSWLPDFEMRQVNLSYNKLAGTFRGLHFQQPPHTEIKVVTCLRGAASDLLVDLRKGSPHFLKHVFVELTAENRQAVVIPAGVAHGFITHSPDTELLYFHSREYVPGAEACVQVNDPQLNIRLPRNIACISDRDKNQEFLPEHFQGIEI